MTDVEFLKESVVRGLAEILIVERGMSLVGALDAIRPSRTFDLLMEDETGLYRESPSYVYQFLKEELGE